MATDGSGGDALQEMTQCVLCHQTFGSDDKDRVSHDQFYTLCFKDPWPREALVEDVERL